MGCGEKCGESTIPLCFKHWYDLPEPLRRSLGKASWGKDKDLFERVMNKAVNHLNGDK